MKRAMLERIAVLLCSLAMLSVSCGDPVTRAKGTVKDAQGNPLAGVTVVLESNSRGDFAKEEDQKTEGDGTYNFINITAPATKARLVFKKEGYVTLEKEVNVNTENNLDVEMELEEK